MEETKTINIGGVIFYVEISAFQRLSEYIDSIRRQFILKEEGEEIVADIEFRIAELLEEFKLYNKEIVNLEMVNRMINNLGKAEQMDGDDDEEASDKSVEVEQEEPQSSRHSGRLYRDGDNAVIGGICAGIGHYLGVKADWIRFIVIISVIGSFGTGLIIYLILCAIIPEARTTSEKLKMRGEPVNLKTIENAISKGLKDFERGFSKFVNKPGKKGGFERSVKNAKRSSQNGISRVFEVLEMILERVVRILAFILIPFSAFAIMLLLVLLFGFIDLFGFGLNEYLGLIDYEAWKSEVWLFSFFFVLVIPFIGLLVATIQLVLNKKKTGKKSIITLGGLWFLSFTVLLFSFGHFGLNQKAGASIDESVKSFEFDEDILIINELTNEGVAVSGNSFDRHEWASREFYFEKENFFFQNVSLSIVSTLDSNFSMVKRLTARGSDYSEALDVARNIEYPIRNSGKKLLLYPELGIGKSAYHFQEVGLIVKVPLGKRVRWENKGHMISHYLNCYQLEEGINYVMTPNGLVREDEDAPEISTM